MREDETEDDHGLSVKVVRREKLLISGRHIQDNYSTSFQRSFQLPAGAEV
jgi:hypothetical protein